MPDYKHHQFTIQLGIIITGAFYSTLLNSYSPLPFLLILRVYGRIIPFPREKHTLLWGGVFGCLSPNPQIWILPTTESQVSLQFHLYLLVSFRFSSARS